MKKTELPKIDFEHPQLESTREGYARGLIRAGERNPDVVALGGDITSSTKVSLFKEKFPDRFLSMGIAEQNMAATACGLALAGKVPFFSTYGVFASGRCWDQIRTSICYGNANVKIGGAHGGVSVGPDGATHQALEEVAIMRCIPNMRVIVPADVHETEKATLWAAENKGPVYIRFGRDAMPIITDEKTPFEFGKIAKYKEGTDVSIIACGPLVFDSLKAAFQLEKEGISVAVYNLSTIKPMDDKGVLEASLTGAVVTAEEAQVMGGMGSAVAESLAKSNPVPMEFVGVQDRFGESGEARELMHVFNVTHKDVVAAVKKVLSRKK
ncbi:transketolase family protein [bacterium]|nr:transketolase family protein [bacterium]MBU3955903.1 transketolase family protein [bacterium]